MTPGGGDTVSSHVSGHRTLGRQSVKAEFDRAHCRKLAAWFDERGRFVYDGPEPGSRERLWNAFSLLAASGKRARALAEPMILGTPVDGNHFTPIAAAELLLRFPDRLTPRARAHLNKLVREHFVNMIEVRFGGGGTNNYTCMTTFFLLAAARVLDGYAWPHKLASIPAVYGRERIHAMGMNALHALAHCGTEEPLFREFNSPTYTPISVHSMAKIVELIDDPDARRIALAIEGRLWREILGFYHPELNLSCGPYSRAYRIDILGQTSQMRVLLCYTGLSRDRSLLPMLDDKLPGLVFHSDGDVPFVWSGPGWQMAGRYHVPREELEEVRGRKYPHRIDFPMRWEPRGKIDGGKRKYIPVQGTVIPGGTCRIRQLQGRNWALGYRSEALYGHSFPIQFHYACAPTVRAMRDVRTVTAAVILRGAPPEWVPGPGGRTVEASNFTNAGRVCVKGRAGQLTFTGRCLPELAALAADELSINTFIPTHFRDVDAVSLNGRVFDGEPIAIKARTASCRVEDAGFVYQVDVRFAVPVTVRLYCWARFIRFAAFWYAGRRRVFEAGQLDRFRVRGSFRVLSAKGSGLKIQELER